MSFPRGIRPGHNQSTGRHWILDKGTRSGSFPLLKGATGTGGSVIGGKDAGDPGKEPEFTATLDGSGGAGGGGLTCGGGECWFSVVEKSES